MLLGYLPFITCKSTWHINTRQKHCAPISRRPPDTMSESISKLPYELIQEILALVGDHSMDSLRSSGLACQTWHTITRPLLFRSIVLDDNDTPQKLTSLISHSPDIAPLIRSVHLLVNHKRDALLDNFFAQPTLSPTILSHLSEIEIVGVAMRHERISQAIQEFTGFRSVRILHLRSCIFQSAEAAYILLYGFPELEEFFCTRMFIDSTLSTSRLEIPGHPKRFPPHLKICYIEPLGDTYSTALSPILTFPIKRTISEYIFTIGSRESSEEIGEFLRNVADMVECLEFTKIPFHIEHDPCECIDLSLFPNLQRLRLSIHCSQLLPSRSASLRRIDLFIVRPFVTDRAINAVVSKLSAPSSNLPCLEEVYFHVIGLHLYTDEWKTYWDKITSTMIPNLCTTILQKRPLRFSVVSPSANDPRLKIMSLNSDL